MNQCKIQQAAFRPHCGKYSFHTFYAHSKWAKSIVFFAGSMQFLLPVGKPKKEHSSSRCSDTTDSFFEPLEIVLCAAPVASSNFVQYVYWTLQYLSVLLAFTPKMSIISKMRPSTLTLNFTDIDELLIVRHGSNWGILFIVVNTLTLNFSANILRVLILTSRLNYLGMEI